MMMGATDVWDRLGSWAPMQLIGARKIPNPRSFRSFYHSRFDGATGESGAKEGGSATTRTVEEGGWLGEKFEERQPAAMAKLKLVRIQYKKGVCMFNHQTNWGRDWFCRRFLTSLSSQFLAWP